ncbi:MAG: hypothetical protein P1P65_05675 [Treponema sp.]
MINTFNETQLHRTLKNLYSPGDSGTERAVEGFICDIYDGHAIIEIQTGHFGALKHKLEKLLPMYRITIVYPVAENAYIRMLNEDGSLRSYRKSPKHGNRYQIFKELLSIAEYTEYPNLSIEILYIDCEVIKIDDKKGRSRYKNPRIIDKRLLKINGEEHIVKSGRLVIPLFDKLPYRFISSDIRKLGSGVYTSYMISFLKKIKKIEFDTKEGRWSVYKKTGA